MKARSIESILCHACGREVGADDNQCRRCGVSLRSAAEGARHAANREAPAKWREMIDHRWVVLLLLFGVMGPLAIPILWKSRGFSVLGKILLSVAVTIYIAALAWCAWLAVKSAYDQIKDLY